MKKEERKTTKKAKYEKPILTKCKKLTDVAANATLVPLGCTRV